jgi:hypothetical protein
MDEDDNTPLTPGDIASQLRHLALCVLDCKELNPSERGAIEGQLRDVCGQLLGRRSGASPTPESKGAEAELLERELTIEDWIVVAAMSPLAPPYTIDPSAVPRGPIPRGEHGAIRGWAEHVARCARALRDLAAEATAISIPVAPPRAAPEPRDYGHLDESSTEAARR